MYQFTPESKIIIYGFGITGKWLSDNLSCEFIIDTDSKKWGAKYNNKEVMSPSVLADIDLSDYIIIVTVVDLFDVIPLLKFYNANWKSLSDFIVQKYSIGINLTNESDEFLKYSIDTVLKCQSASKDLDTFYIRSVDLVITEKCTLKCKDCANLMQFYDKPNTYEYESIIQGLIELSNKTSFIHEVRVIGGEPFLNKDIYKILDKISKINNINKIVIYTNGMIPPKENELLKIFNINNILFSITDYAELGRNLDTTLKILRKLKIPFRVHPPEHWTDSGKILKLNTNIDNAKNLFAKCCGKNLFTLISDKLYRCPFAANADNLKALPLSENNYVNVHEDKKSVRNYLYDIDYIDACMLCPGRSFDAPVIKPAQQVKEPISYRKYIPINEINHLVKKENI
jgi:organic radical activating enzyme